MPRFSRPGFASTTTPPPWSTGRPSTSCRPSPAAEPAGTCSGLGSVTGASAPRPSASDRAHRSVGLEEARVVDVMAGPLAGDAGTQCRGDRLVVTAGAHDGAHVGLGRGEEAGTQLAVGGQSQPVAGPAER